jgi:hypothetical protein
MAADEGRQQLLEEVVTALQNIRSGTGLKRTVAAGEVILKLLFAGDPAAWHSQRRNKLESLRGLARTKGCTMSRSALSQAVAVHVATAGLSLDELRHVQASHVLAIWSLPPDVGRQLLLEAERERHSVRALRRRVALLNGVGQPVSEPAAASSVLERSEAASPENRPSAARQYAGKAAFAHSVSSASD